MPPLPGGTSLPSATGPRLTRRAALGLTGLALASRHPALAQVDPWALADTIRARITVPTFPQRDFVITSYGATGNGTSSATKAIAAAIKACANAGGGRVVIPAGNRGNIFLTGAIKLRSNVNLHVETGATLRFSTDPASYLPVVRTSYEGSDYLGYCPFIYASGRKNVAVTGGGTLDGQASNAFWWPWSGNPNRGWTPGMPSQEPDRSNLHAQNAAGVPVAQRVYGAGHYLRPSMVQFRSCTNVLVDRVTLRNAPFWMIHPLLCRNVTIRDVTTISRGPNNDGVDVENCQDVLVQGCTFDTGDDCLAIKAGRAVDGLGRTLSSRYIVIAGNQMANGIGGVVLGSEQSRGIADVFVEDLTGTDPDLAFGLLLKSNRRWGAGKIERVRARRIDLAGVRNAAVGINQRFGGIDDGSYLPLVSDVEVRELTCARATNALTITGLPDAPVSGVRLADSTLTGVTGTPVVRTNVTGLELSNVRVNGSLVRI